MPTFNRSGLSGVYRKRPAIVKAIQFWYDLPQIPGVIYQPIDGKFYVGDAYVENNSGQMKVFNGDWVITGADGQQWVCEGQYFDELYEAVDHADI